MDCGGAQCHTEIKPTDDVFDCSRCSGKYHRQCLSISKEQHNLLHPDFFKSWVCPSCSNINTRRLRSNPDTPVRSHQLPIGEHSLDMSLDSSQLATGDNSTDYTAVTPVNRLRVARGSVTIDEISSLLDQKINTTVSSLIEDKLNTSLSAFMNTFRTAIQEDVRKLVQSEVKSVIQDLENNFTATTDFICAEQDSFKTLISEQSDKIRSLENENAKLQTSLQNVTTRLSNMENISRSYNLELHVVPEKKNENVLLLFKNLCATNKMTLPDNCITACRRVAKMDAKSTRPRNILVTLSSPLLRDTVLSMVSRFNKSIRNSEGATTAALLNTSHLGMPGKGTRIYVVEHLSPETKLLLAETRKVAKAKGHSIVWTRYGKIYVRKNEESDAIHIKDTSCLKKIV